MIKHYENLETYYFSKTHSIGLSEFLEKKKKKKHGHGGMWGWVCGCVNKVCMEITGCVNGVGVCLGRGWVSEFWMSGTGMIVCVLIL